MDIEVKVIELSDSDRRLLNAASHLLRAANPDDPGLRDELQRMADRIQNVSGGKDDIQSYSAGIK